MKAKPLSAVFDNIAKEYGISQPQVSNIKRGLSWQ